VEPWVGAHVNQHIHRGAQGARVFKRSSIREQKRKDSTRTPPSRAGIQIIFKRGIVKMKGISERVGVEKQLNAGGKKEDEHQRAARKKTLA